MFKESGAPEHGFPIALVMTNSAWSSHSTSRKVVELSSEPFNRALFDVPEDFFHTNRWHRALMNQAANAGRQSQTSVGQFVGLK